MTEVAKDDAITVSSPSSTLIDSTSEENPDVARLTRLAAGAAGCTLSAVYRRVRESDHQLVYAIGGAPSFEKVRSEERRVGKGCGCGGAACGGRRKKEGR